jgi:2-amino-4-hydroxy-6-hydroxymethyldihydropteridine diphosphokinase
MNSAVISLGSNVGDRSGNLNAAIQKIEKIPCSVIRRSSVYETAPWGNTSQPSFYNQVVVLETPLDAFALMRQLLSIEKGMGRTRNLKWEPRIIDIDILFFNEEKIDTEELKVPHPHLHERKFVLAPLNEIAPGKIHPMLLKTVSQLLSALKDDSSVEKLKSVSQE